MKKLLSFIILLFSISAYAKAPYGFTPYFPADYPHSAIYNMLLHKPIKYHISVTHPKKLSEEELLNLKIAKAKFTQDIEIAFNIWPAGLNLYLINSGRMNEFRDIIKQLPQKVETEQTENAKETDIFFTFTDMETLKKLCGPNRLACHSNIMPFGVNQIIVPNPLIYKDINILNILTHEIGHYFGLSDQYKEDLSSDEYNNDRIQKGVSVMDSPNVIFGCDDADGLINLIDYTSAKINKGRYSQRAQKGWLTFCGDDSYYKNAKPYIRNYCFVEYDSNGKQKGLNCPEPFLFFNKSYRFDKNGLLTAAKDKAKNITTSYEYFLKENRISVTSVYGGYTNKSGPVITMQIIKNDEDSWRIPLYGKIYNFTLKNGECTYSLQDKLYSFQREYSKNKANIKKSKSFYEFSIENDINLTNIVQQDIPFLPQDKLKNTFLYPQTFSAQQKVCAYLKEVTSKMNASL